MYQSVYHISCIKHQNNITKHVTIIENTRLNVKYSTCPNTEKECLPKARTWWKLLGILTTHEHVCEERECDREKAIERDIERGEREEKIRKRGEEQESEREKGRTKFREREKERTVWEREEKKEIEETRREGRRKEERERRGRLAGSSETYRGHRQAWAASDKWVPGEEVGKGDGSGDQDDDGVVVIVGDGDGGGEVVMDGGE